MTAGFHGDRILLLPFTPDDQQLLYDLFTDPFIRKYLWDDEILTQEATGEILDQNTKLLEENAWGLWKIILNPTGSVIGFAGLWSFFDEPQPQLIYGLRKPHTGNGYAQEAAQLVISYAFNKLGFSYLDASMDKPHLASQKVAEKLQMTRFKEAVIDGKETVFYRLTSNRPHEFG